MTSPSAKPRHPAPASRFLHPDGSTVAYAYDGMNRLTEVTGIDGEKTSFAYDALGQRISTVSGGVTEEYGRAFDLSERCRVH